MPAEGVLRIDVIGIEKDREQDALKGDVKILAKVAELVDSMPQGLETPLGRLFGEHDLSGGQWQRCRRARLHARGWNLDMDEPTSNLNARAESELFQQFWELAGGRTAIVVSHRFTTVSMADRNIVLDVGGSVMRRLGNTP